jgi:hypothetical protein
MAELSQTDFARLVELLPWYVNGTLGESDRAWVDACVAAHPEARQELVWFQTLGVEIREKELHAPADIGMERAIARIRSEAKQAAPTSLWQRLVSWLADAMPSGLPRFAPAMAVLAALIVLQTAILTNVLFKPDDKTTVRSGAKGWADGPLLRVSFIPDAKESDIRLLLVETQALIVAGPSSLGDYYLKVAPARIADVVVRMKASTVVQAIDQVPSLPETMLER